MSKFTRDAFTRAVLSIGVKLSMDVKDSATDNPFIERLWSSVKYEEIYIHPSTDGLDLHQKTNHYMYYYNNARRCSSIDDLTLITQ